MTEREAFEAWAREFDWLLATPRDIALEAWQAAAARYALIMEAVRMEPGESRDWALMVALAALDGAK